MEVRHPIAIIEENFAQGPGGFFLVYSFIQPIFLELLL